MRIRYFGDILIELREEKDELQKSAARSCEVNQNTWSQYEKNKRVPRMEVFKKIAEYYNVSIDYLIGRSQVKYNPKDEVVQKLIEKYTSLSSDDKISFIKYIDDYKKEN